MLLYYMTYPESIGAALITLLLVITMTLLLTNATSNRSKTQSESKPVPSSPASDTYCTVLFFRCGR